jgi:hypothetical protein
MSDYLIRFGKIPSNIDFDEIFNGVKGNSTKIKFLKDGMVYLLSLIVIDNYTLTDSKDGFKRLNDQILSDVIGDKRPVQITKILKEKGVIDIKPHSKGRYPKGYRLTDKYNVGEFKNVEYSDRIKNKLNDHLHKNMKERNMEIEFFYILNQFDKNKISFDSEWKKRTC